MSTLFEQVCDSQNLLQAWHKVRAGKTWAQRCQGAGVDGMTIAQWEQDWPLRLQALQAALWGGTYRPQPLHRFQIPRRDGGPPRCLAIPTVTDRVAQRAVLNIVEPLWETVFLSCSHGYRPQRSVFTAIAHVLWHRGRGLTWVVDADIADYFNMVTHGRLLNQLAVLADEQVLGLIAAWLAIGATHPGRGIAQGAPLSPLLANVYLHPFDVALVQAGLALVRYADDLVILCPNFAAAQRALVSAAYALAELDLALNPNKTTIIPFGPDLMFLGAQFQE